MSRVETRGPKIRSKLNKLDQKCTHFSVSQYTVMINELLIRNAKWWRHLPNNSRFRMLSQSPWLADLNVKGP